MESFHYLNADHLHPKRLSQERQKARLLRKSQWWKNLLNQGLCHYCGEKFDPVDLTMDHVIPLARGGKSNRGNIVLACQPCNRKKHLDTPVDLILSSGHV